MHNQGAPSFWACNLCEICFEELSNIIENLHFLLDTMLFSISVSELHLQQDDGG